MYRPVYIHTPRVEGEASCRFLPLIAADTVLSVAQLICCLGGWMDRPAGGLLGWCFIWRLGELALFSPFEVTLLPADLALSPLQCVWDAAVKATRPAFAGCVAVLRVVCIAFLFNFCVLF